MSTPPPQPLSPPPVLDLQFDVIVADILPRLPAKSLLRFKSVCKSFNTLISSPEFARLHLRHSLLSYHHRLIAVPAIDGTLYTFESLGAASATFTWPEFSTTTTVFGSCHGLLLVLGDHPHLLILNPCTRTYVDVPYIANDNLGFGFDHRSHNYKIVVVYEDHTDVLKTRTTEVYCVNTNSWKVVDHSPRADSIEQRFGGALVDDHLLHWMFQCPLKVKQRIGCFDICLEKWTDDVVLPSHKNDLLDFGVVDGRMFTTFHNRVDVSYDVWVMKQYGVQESWTKLLSFPFMKGLLGGMVPIACRQRDSQVLIRQVHEPNLFWYNTVDGTINKVQVPNFWNLRLYICNTSLVALPGAKHFGAVYEPPVEQLRHRRLRN